VGEGFCRLSRERASATSPQASSYGEHRLLAAAERTLADAHRTASEFALARHLSVSPPRQPASLNHGIQWSRRAFCTRPDTGANRPEDFCHSAHDHANL
jgi:hypothetical protein